MIYNVSFKLQHLIEICLQRLTSETAVDYLSSSIISQIIKLFIFKNNYSSYTYNAVTMMSYQQSYKSTSIVYILKKSKLNLDSTDYKGPSV